jgi:hypothetical protein
VSDNPLDRLRDAVVRVAHIGKLKLHANFDRRERDELVLRLGETVLDLLQRGEIAEHEALSGLLAAIRQLDARREEALRTAEALKSELGTPEPTKT